MDSSAGLGSRVAKIAAWTAAGIVGLVAVGLLGVWLFVNPNDYKGRIAAAVKASTGRDLVLTGDIRLSVFPRIALELGPAQFGNPPGFGAEPFVAFQRAAVRAQLWPLLHGRLAVNSIEIDGLDLRLKKDAHGHGNWEDLIAAPGPVGGRDASTAKRADTASSRMFEGLEGIRIRDSRVSYQELQFEKLNVQIGRYAENAAVPIEVGFVFEGGSGGSPGGRPDASAVAASVPTVSEPAADGSGYQLTVDAKMDLRMDSAARRLGVAKVAIDGALRLAGKDRAIAWRIAVPAVEVDLGMQTLAAPAVAVEFGGAQFSAGVHGTGIIDALALTGTVTLAPLRVREFLAQLSLENPRTRDPSVLSVLVGSGTFVYGSNAVRLDDLALELDQTHLRGQVDIVDLMTPAVNFELTADRIDVDRYLEPDGTPPDPKHTPFELPTAALKAFNANGSVTLASARVGGVEFKALKLVVESQQAVAQRAPADAEKTRASQRPKVGTS